MCNSIAIQWKLAARKSMPASNELVNGEQASPRAASKGVAMMIELYNKHKGESPLPDVDEQTLASLDDEMFKRGKSLPTSPGKWDEQHSMHACNKSHPMVKKTNLLKAEKAEMKGRATAPNTF